MVQKKNDPNKIDNKHETIVHIVASIKSNWWKVVFIILAIGIAITGFTCSWKDIIVKKDPIYQKKEGK